MGKDQDLIRLAREVLQKESQALLSGAERIGDEFEGLCGKILATKGKVVVTGLGKSGHVGRKIAATLSSTGTPAVFLHPSEALHGDLGMLTGSDLLLAIAFGGETREVIEVAKFAKRLGVAVAALSGRLESSLVSLADFVLDGSIAEEACPLNLAPTTSTTLAMALGDAMAVTLMHARGFQEQDFAAFHPEGSLGRRLSMVADHMRPLTELGLLRRTDDFHKTLEMVTTGNFGIAAVVNEQGGLEGAVTDGDVRRALLRHEGGVFRFRAGDLMSGAPKTILAKQLSLVAVGKMEEHRITSLFVVDSGGQLLGMVRMHDLLNAKIV